MKKFTVILRESWQTEATVYAETEEEARKIAEDELDSGNDNFDPICGWQTDSGIEVYEEKGE